MLLKLSVGMHLNTILVFFGRQTNKQHGLWEMLVVKPSLQQVMAIPRHDAHKGRSVNSIMVKEVAVTLLDLAVTHKGLSQLLSGFSK